MKQQPPPPSMWGSLGALAGMGFTIAVPIVFFAVLGNYLDGLIHTGSLFILLGLLLGLITGTYGAYRLFKSVFK
ncbi:MAG TPA: AtpZ/AtpI family protein [Ktedonobacteraceae bacterium]|jgi:ATP synthase protein I